MRKTLGWIFILLFSTSALAALDPKIEELADKKLPPIEEPDIQIQTLPNGIKIYYTQDEELPLFKIATYFKTGQVYESKQERGLNSFFMSAWRSGGTKKMSPEEIDEKLEFYAASISAASGSELSHIDMKSLSKNAGEILDIYFDLIRHPAFDKERIEIIRKSQLNAIEQRNEEPMPIALREFKQSLYGENSPHAWLSTKETIQSITQEKLKHYYQNQIAPNQILLAAASPLSFADFLKRIQPYLADWNKKLPDKKYPTQIVKEWQKSVEFIQKPGNQSAIVMGHFGEKRFNSDRFKILLADEILGGATFGSKLGDRIRTELGLAYGVQSGFGFETDYGAFLMATRTKSESTLQTIREMQNIFANMVEEKNISQQELNLAKERILNRLVFEYENPFHIVEMRLVYDYHGYPPNYLKYFQKKVDAVTLQEVRDVLSTYFFPKKLKMMIVGDQEKIQNLDELEGLVEKPLDME